jgi:SSS family solute:Na+ symporter
VSSALDTWWELAGIFSGGMLGLFLLGRLSRRATNAAALSAVGLGVVVISWMSLSPRLTGAWLWLRSPFHNFLVIVIGTLTILLTGLAVSRFFPGRQTNSTASSDPSPALTK